MVCSCFQQRCAQEIWHQVSRNLHQYSLTKMILSCGRWLEYQTKYCQNFLPEEVKVEAPENKGTVYTYRGM